MKMTLARLGLVALVVGAMAGCGGGGGGTAAPPDGGGGGGGGGAANVAGAIAKAAPVAANDTSTNSTASFAVLQNAGLPVVTVASPPKVRFTVFSDGEVVTGLTTSNARFIIAKLVPGTNGNPDQWASYTYRTETAAAGVGPGGTPALASATQATTDTALSPDQLVYNADGYYTYTFTTDIKDATKTNGVTYEPGRTHRVAIQLSYTNKAGQTVLVNPYFDFTLDADGNSVAVTDPNKTRKVVDVSTCNECHNKLALHGGGRVDTQYCVLCHNSGTTDANSGNVLDLRTMAHKIHAGRFLHEKGENYVIWGFNNGEHNYSEVGFPANVRNCTKCHDGSKKDAAGKQLAAQGDNWKEVPTKEACLTCHQTGTTSNWYNVHVTQLKLGTSVKNITNADCASCHGPGKTWNAEQVHWLQELANTARYQNKIESVTLTTAPTATTDGVLTVKYAVINPVSGSAYDLRVGCTGTPTTDDAGASIPGCNTNYRWYTSTPPGAPQDKFGTISLTLAVNTYTQTTDDTVATTSRNAYQGVDNGNHHYTIKLTVPKGSHGNARVVMLGSVAERRIDPVSRAPVGAVPPVTHEDLAYVPVKNAISEINLDNGTASAGRRKIVSNDKCNACHAFLGIPMNPEPGAHAFHSGVRNNSENCEVCHNASRAGSYTAMADGTNPAFNESWQFRRMVHALHGRDKRTYAFTHGNDQIGPFGLDGAPLAGATTTLGNFLGGTTEVINYTAEVIFPGRLADCNTCHVNDSWKENRAILGSAVVSTSLSKNAGGTAYTNPGINRLVASGACVGQTGSVATLDLACTSIDPLKVPVISPKASVCLSCHDAGGVQLHAINVGGAIFGGSGGTAAVNQGDILSGKVFEACDGCHGIGAFKGIDTAHGLK